MSETRRERSRQRAVEHKRRQKRGRFVFWVAAGLYLLGPLVWNAGIEFGFWHPIQTTKLQHSVDLVRCTLLLLALHYGLSSYYRNSWPFTKKKDGPKATQGKTTPTP